MFKKRTPKQIKAGIKRRLKRVFLAVTGRSNDTVAAPPKPKPKPQLHELTVSARQVLVLDWSSALLVSRLVPFDTPILYLVGNPPAVDLNMPAEITTSGAAEILFPIRPDDAANAAFAKFTPAPQSIRRIQRWEQGVDALATDKVNIVLSGVVPRQSRAVTILKTLLDADKVGLIFHATDKPTKAPQIPGVDISGMYRPFDIEASKKLPSAKRPENTTRARVVKRPVDLDSVDRIRRFSERLADTPLPHSFDLVHAVDLPSAPAGLRLSRRSNAELTIDINEFPWLEHRVGKFYRELSSVRMAELNGMIIEPLRNATHLIATSVGLCRVTRRRFAVSPRPFRNFHDPIRTRKTNKMRKDCGAADSDIVLVHPCTYSLSYKSDECIHLVARQPDKYRLVFVGQPGSLEDHERLVTLARDLGVQDRVYFKGTISNPNEYLNYLAGADIGLVMLSEAVANVRFGLTNRFVDLVAAGVPMISTPSAETRGVIEKRQLGWVSKTVSAKTFEDCIAAWELLPKTRKEALRKNVRLYSKNQSWKSEFQDFCAHVPALSGDDPAPKVAIVFQRGLVKNRRVLRLARSLIDDRGALVTIYVTTMPPATTRAAHPDISFVRI